MNFVGIFDKLFGRKTDTKQPAQQPTLEEMVATRPTRTIAYDANLVDDLKNDHQALVAMFGSIGDAAKAGDDATLSRLLVDFKTYLESHLLKENVRFYVYLEQSMADDPDNMLLIKDFRREMNHIARGVVEFVKTYQNQRMDTALRAQFLEDYEKVGQLLGMRIQREEGQLYTLYHA